MTQKFLADGTVVPVTRIIAGPCFVMEKKTQSKNGYCSVKLGWGEAKRVDQPTKGMIKKSLNKDLNIKYFKEFRLTEKDPMYDKLNVGQIVNVAAFNVGDIVIVQGRSKGRGFQGVVKRHRFAGGPASHGHKDNLRMPGSIGATHPNHVVKGMRMPGHMGDVVVTVSNLEVVEVNPENNEIFLNGSIPGARNGVLFMRADGEFTAIDENTTEKKEEKVEEKSEEKAEEAVVENNNSENVETTEKTQ